MLNRRTVILASAGAAFAGICNAGAADAAARAFLTAIYNAYRGKDSKGVPLDSDVAINRYFEPGLAALISQDARQAASRGEVGKLDGDPFIDAQDWEITSFEITLRDTGPDKAAGTVSFTNLGQPTTVVLDLVKLKAGWRIADITCSATARRRRCASFLLKGERAAARAASAS